MFALVQTGAINRWRQHLTDVRTVEVSVPWYQAARDGIDYIKTSEINSGSSYIADSFNVFAKLKALVRRFDIVITDYEPVCAAYSFLEDIPLVCIHQQGKFLGWKTPDVRGFTRESEIARQRLMFPRASHRISPSFFAMPFPNDDRFVTTLTRPIVRPEICNVIATNPDVTKPDTMLGSGPINGIPESAVI